MPKPKLTKAQEKLDFDFIKLIHDSGGRANHKLIVKFREIVTKELDIQRKEFESIVSKHIGSCDQPCEECRTAREILKAIK